MKLFVGLGNPGSRYLSNRHNVGFVAAESIGNRLEADFDEKFCSSAVASGRSKGEKVIIAKPQTYMNLSGKAVFALLKRFSLNAGDLTVIHDDIDIPLGKVKEKKGGGAGGHNGILSIVEEIGTNEFRRLRIGVGRPPNGADTADYVLSDFEESEKELIAESIEESVRLAVNF